MWGDLSGMRTGKVYCLKNWLPFKASQGMGSTLEFPYVIIVSSLFLLMIMEVILKLLN